MSGIKTYIRCPECKVCAPEHAFAYGLGLDVGQPPEERYCPFCKRPIHWVAFMVRTFLGLDIRKKDEAAP